MSLIRTSCALTCLALVSAALIPTPARAQFLANSLTTSATDPDLINAWGMSSSGASPMWVSDNGTGKATVYTINPVTNSLTKAGLVVSIPGNGTPTGQVFNGTAGAFNSDNFLFASEDGTISGWRGALGTNAEVLQTASSANEYKGLAIGTVSGNAYAYAANFKTGAIDVIKGTIAAPNLTGNFVDPSLPAGYAPFNIQNLGGTLYVTYALVGPTGDDVAGVGNGFVDAFDLNGNLLGRVGSQGTLNSPWGLAIAPSTYGNFANDLLVGNFGDGTIDVYNPNTDVYLGQLLDGTSSNPLSIDGLWGLRAGNGGNAGNAGFIYFSAGPQDESAGVLGFLAPAQTPEPGSLAALFGAGITGAFLLRRKRRGN